MRSKLAIKVAPLALLCLLAVVPAHAAEVIGVVPEGALGFGVVNRLSDTDAKVTKLANQFQIPVRGIVGMGQNRTPAKHSRIL